MRIWPTKRYWKRLAIGAAILVALALIANSFMAWRTESRLQAKIAEIRAVGDPATISDLAPDPIPDDENAAAILEQLMPRLDEFAKDHVHFLDRTDLGKDYESRQRRGEAPTSEQIAAFQSIIDKYPDLQAGIAAAASCGQYASLSDFSLSSQDFLQQQFDSQIGYPRTAARFNDWRVQTLLAAGKPEEATRVGFQTLRLARLHDGEPLLVNYLVGLALRMISVRMLYDALAAGPISPDLHSQIERELQLHDSPMRFVNAMTTERAYGNSIAVESGLPPLSGEINPIWLKLAGWPIKRLYVNGLGVYDELFELAGRQYFEVRDQLKSDESMPTSKYGIIGVLIAPGFRTAYESNARGIATIRSLRIANALAQYRDEHGREASGLADLPLPREATIDPFSGEPLKLKHTLDGWVIYSVMQNGVDDGGDFNQGKDDGLAPAKWRNTH